MTIIQYATRDFNTSGRIINIGEEEMPIKIIIWQDNVKVQMIMMKEKIIGNLIIKGNEIAFSHLQKLQEFENIVGDMESSGLGIGQFVISMKGAR